MNWDDLRVFLAIADQGSLAGAARQLRVNHSTVFRRLNTIEEDLKVRLFERLPRGYVLTAAGEEMTVAARRVEADVADIERRIVGRARSYSWVSHRSLNSQLGAGRIFRV